ncbi:MAG TPA: DNA repair protein RadA [Saprospiraceae bacterium]|nr:DNA repair protein RadA [Saprospiraceae bacterium]
MAKVKSVYVCSNCGAQSPKWIGKCSSCNEWNTYTEEIHTQKKNKPGQLNSPFSGTKPTLLNDIQTGKFLRISSEDEELNRVLGGGIVPGSVILISGQPGIGKSTLMLQIALSTQGKILYITGEESDEQIKMRADRIQQPVGECYIYADTEISAIIQQARALQPNVIVVDSIQTMYLDYLESSAGTVSQIRESTAELQRFAKEQNIALFIIGHITKDGDIAGPKLLEHMVDVVLYFEGDRNYAYRILRARKNRFGSADEIGIYEMFEDGLKQVKNASQVLANRHEEAYSGNALGIIGEGSRNYLIEVQALVSRAVYGTPQRSATGYDPRRMNMLLAVLEKKCQLPLGYNDVFLNIAGGLRVDDPSIDLPLAMAVISSLENRPVSPDFAFVGEIGLSGEIRPGRKLNQKILEAQKFGINTVFVSAYAKSIQSSGNTKIIYLSRVDQLPDLLNS